VISSIPIIANSNINTLLYYTIMTTVRYLLIDGNIGAGKSTLIKEYLIDVLSIHYHVIVLDEIIPHKELNRFYEWLDTRDGPCPAYDLESRFQQMREQQLKDCIDDTKLIQQFYSIMASSEYKPYRDMPKDIIVIIDRSIIGNMAFAFNDMTSGYLSRKQWFELWTQFNKSEFISLFSEPDESVIGIYLDCSIDVLLQRINSRNPNVDEETKIQPEYLARIDDAHKLMYRFFGIKPIIIVNGRQSHLKDIADNITDIVSKKWSTTHT
jgi:deoxyadenosine/deoxycytidine kinase